MTRPRHQRARLLVLVTGLATLSHLGGLIFLQGRTEEGGMETEALLLAFLTCMAWMLAAMTAVDQPGRGRETLSRWLAKPGRFVAWQIAMQAALLVAVALAMIPFNDEQSNLAAGQYLADFHLRAYFANYAELNSWLGPHHPPLWPMIYAVIFAAFDESLLAGRALAVICSLTAIYLGYRWVRRIVDEPHAAVAVAVLPAMPMALFVGAAAILDAPFWMVAMLALLAVDRFFERGRTRDALVAGGALGLAMLSRYNGFLLPPIVLALWFARPRDERLPLLKAGWPLAAAPAAIFLPWVVYAASNGTLVKQVTTMLSLVGVAVIPEGGLFYLAFIIAPLYPFFIGLWNVPLWVASAGRKVWRDPAWRPVLIVAGLYLLLMLLTLPNPRYILAISIPLAALAARQILLVEAEEGRGASVLVALVGYAVIHLVLILQQAAVDAFYIFY
ncbi:MAG: glycosyltransferase family 39 protein [Deltaproteobacteria bacterium]|nr:glycosyltransferase family 39 protein [Deltaproteobacteria bacterium]MCB9478247.1 glycosyltransferase family 39 protein [Deltaproteobacteria bacterium]